jgi:2-aminoethylphosphonate dioxygenase
MTIVKPHSFSPENPAAAGFYDTHGWVLTDLLGDTQVHSLRAWTDEVATWPDTPGRWLHYREMTDGGPRLCRSENFVPFHDGMKLLLTQGPLVATASALLGENAVLYKEKINYKLAGGAGYAPHQDAPAYPFISTHISCMVAIDDSDESNGCLEAVSGQHHRLLPTDDVGCIPASVVDSFEWIPVPVQAGQALWFHSRTPHRSGANLSSTDRRALYPTYNAASEGDLRASYYAEKLEAMSHRSIGDHVQVSLIGDFQGRPVPTAG